ncbi:N-acetylmuramic acid 6-phosphate etherase [Rhodobacter sp. SGA-6-6]|uniref:N-acetylmuramic acid 6-phosphate etherase n=1 Tax=Rhodobacter sp. SGA-6-6 TaxID=2710882 RepID=UPI0013ED98C8|nr:N-acetylmuramic acid 6-phosphate etherase [Rhodobacter sp. SGA-6-6]NGM44423.1 N-acetylmuramic acid 6-phosphate etherase [Rhodobacter sp. SGA-6-6]
MAEGSTEARHPGSAGLHAAGGAEVLARLLDAQAAALEAVRPAIPSLQQVAEAAAEVLRAGGRLAYVGAGSSGLMALSDCLELAGTFGIPPDRTPMLFAGGTAALLHMTGAVEDDPALAKADFAAAGLQAGDMALCLSASGTTPYTLEVAALARAAGVKVAGIANVAGSALLRAADLPVLLETGPEIVTGSTRMGAATAQKAALNMVSVLVGIRLGHVHDGYMVNVVADNAKLRARAARIVSALSGADIGTARAALEATAGAVKPAVLVARGRPAAQAAGDLTESRGHLSPWLER